MKKDRTLETTNNIITSILYFGSEPEAWGYAKAITMLKQFRVESYGVDRDGDAYVILQELRFPYGYTKPQYDRWKATGELTVT